MHGLSGSRLLELSPADFLKHLHLSERGGTVPPNVRSTCQVQIQSFLTLLYPLPWLPELFLCDGTGDACLCSCSLQLPLGGVPLKFAMQLLLSGKQATWPSLGVLLNVFSGVLKGPCKQIWLFCIPKISDYNGSYIHETMRKPETTQKMIWFSWFTPNSRDVVPTLMDRQIFIESKTQFCIVGGLSGCMWSEFPCAADLRRTTRQPRIPAWRLNCNFWWDDVGRYTYLKAYAWQPGAGQHGRGRKDVGSRGDGPQTHTHTHTHTRTHTHTHTHIDIQV